MPESPSRIRGAQSRGTSAIRQLGRFDCEWWDLRVSRADRRASIVVSSQEEVYSLRGDTIDQPMLLCDAARPAPRKSEFQGFRFPGTVKGIADDGLNQIEDPDGDVTLVLDPETQVLNELRLECGGPFRFALRRASLPARPSWGWVSPCPLPRGEAQSSGGPRCEATAASVPFRGGRRVRMPESRPHRGRLSVERLRFPADRPPGRGRWRGSPEDWNTLFPSAWVRSLQCTGILYR